MNRKLVITPLVIVAALCIALEPARAQEPANPPQGGGNKAGIQFNRLLKKPKVYNPPPAEDGAHDPQNEGTYMLQPPMDVFKHMPKAQSGNRVDWVKALNDGVINPRWDRLDPAAEPDVFEFDVLREVRGSMPNVLFPHDRHTQWLACENCHDDIFIPQVGANQISMALILMGQKCGVCHGKVAFPPTQCRKCHSQKKDAMVKKKPRQQ
ncbi:MAG: c(7)-type cytochrome triheme domain-containing protein [Candidatus Nitrospinota bacterium M3_3B_026]